MSWRWSLSRDLKALRVTKIATDAAASVTVSDLAGRVIYAGQVNAGTTEIAVAAEGVVLVKVAGKVAKVAL